MILRGAPPVNGKIDFKNHFEPIKFWNQKIFLQRAPRSTEKIDFKNHFEDINFWD